MPPTDGEHGVQYASGTRITVRIRDPDRGLQEVRGALWVLKAEEDELGHQNNHKTATKEGRESKEAQRADQMMLLL